MAEVSLPSIQEALASVKDMVGAVGKNDRNTVQNFKFRGIDAVVNAAAPALNKFGVIVTPKVLSYNYDTVEVGKNRTPMGHVVIHAEYWFTGPKGDSLGTAVLGEAMDSGDKAVPKAMSVAYRIALLQTLNLPTDEPDPDTESYTRSERTEQETRYVADRQKPSESQDLVLTGLGIKAKNAKSVSELRSVWTDAGKRGCLQKPYGTFATFQDFLYKRNDELAAKDPKDAEQSAIQNLKDGGLA